MNDAQRLEWTRQVVEGLRNAGLTLNDLEKIALTTYEDATALGPLGTHRAMSALRDFLESNELAGDWGLYAQWIKGFAKGATVVASGGASHLAITADDSLSNQAFAQGYNWATTSV